MTDQQLLRQFVQNGSQAAFSQIVARHLNFVYTICRRETGDAALAEDVTQVVFLLLARKAPSLRVEASLSGWLFQTARFASKNARRREAHRKTQEQAVAEQMSSSPEKNALWVHIEPHFNSALAALSAKDREAVLLRFADGLSFPELSAALGTSEDAARMRLNRAVSRLRQSFARAGITVSAAVLAGLLAERIVQAAPPASAALLAKIGGSGATVSPQVSFHYQGVLKAMTMTKISFAVAGMFAASVTILPLMTFAQSHQAKRTKLVVKPLMATNPPGSLPALELKDGFTLRYDLTEKDMRTPQMRLLEAKQFASAEQHAVLQGFQKQADADRAIQSEKTVDTMPVTPHEYHVTLSAQNGKLLYISEQHGTPSYGLTPDNRWITEPYETKVVLYDGQKTYSIRSCPQSNVVPHMEIYTGFRPDNMMNCLLPGAGLPSMPLVKAASSATLSSGAAIRCDVFSFSGNKYWPGMVTLQGAGRNAKLSRMVVGQPDHPMEVWKFQKPQAFQGSWISRIAVHATFPFMFLDKSVPSGPLKIAKYAVTDIQPSPLSISQFDISTYLVPNMDVEDHSVQKYGMETHSFRYNPAGGDLEVQEKAATAH